MANMMMMMNVNIQSSIELEVERNHYYWQLISHLHNLISTCLNTINDLPAKNTMQPLTKEYITLDLTVLLTHLARYNEIISDHAIGVEESSSMQSEQVGQVTQTAQPDQPGLLDSLEALAQPAQPAQSMLMDDLLGGQMLEQSVPTSMVTPSTEPPMAMSAVDLNDLLGVPMSAPAPAPEPAPAPAPMMPTSALDDLLGGVAPTAPVMADPAADMFSLGGATADAGAMMPMMMNEEPVVDVVPLLEEKYRPLYGEAVLIAREVKLLVQNIIFPHNSLAFLSQLNNVLRTLDTEVRKRS